jgi:hypothetical protein
VLFTLLVVVVVMLFMWSSLLLLLLLLVIVDVIDIFVNCNWVDTWWQWYSTHLHKQYVEQHN